MQERSDHGGQAKPQSSCRAVAQVPSLLMTGYAKAQSREVAAADDLEMGGADARAVQPKKRPIAIIFLSSVLGFTLWPTVSELVSRHHVATSASSAVPTHSDVRRDTPHARLGSAGAAQQAAPTVPVSAALPHLQKPGDNADAAQLWQQNIAQHDTLRTRSPIDQHPGAHEQRPQLAQALAASAQPGASTYRASPRPALGQPTFAPISPNTWPSAHVRPLGAPAADLSFGSAFYSPPKAPFPPPPPRPPPLGRPSLSARR